MKQASQTSFNGNTTVKRWFVTLPNGQRVVSWAQTRAGVAAKCLERRGVRPTKIEPAPTMLINDPLFMLEDGE